VAADIGADRVAATADADAHGMTSADANIPVIVGPTASGKSSLASAVCDALSARGAQGEIITMDSMQVYQGMDIGTAKPNAAERARTPNHMIDIVEPSETFTVEQWLEHAEREIARIRSRGALPVLAGGTHLYATAFLRGLFEGPPADDALRAELSALATSELRAELERVDPVAAERIHPNDQRRTIRAIEVYRRTGTRISEHQRQWNNADDVRQDARLFVLMWPRERLNRRINDRVRDMIDAGLVEEARGLWEGNALGDTASQALGYKQLMAYFDGRCSLSDAIEQIKIETRRFAKNQRTWLRRLATTPGAVMLDAAAMSREAMVERVLDETRMRPG
jgi:tRNA dimethylallyltransferase